MTFEEWGEWPMTKPGHVLDVIYVDWKAEREDLLHANEVLGKENVRVISQREKLIGALAETTVMLKVLHGTNNKPKCADVKCAYCLRADTNRAVLAEAKGGKV